MQLREQGKLDLDTDVNEYLTTLTVPDTFPEPVTLRHLMSHSSGIEDRIVQLFGDEVADMQPYAEMLSRELPDRVRAPGTVSTYSNHGVGLAGLVLEEVSGEKWEDYVQQHILDPLQMSSATAFQPVPEELAGQLSQGYAFELGKHVEKPFEYVRLGAAEWHECQCPGDDPLCPGAPGRWQCRRSANPVWRVCGFDAGAPVR